MTTSKATIFRIEILLCLCTVLVSSSLAQSPVPEPPKARAPERPVANVRPMATPAPPRIPRDERVTTERAIAVDPAVNLKFCVSEGALTINGWDREEVRVFVKDGRRFGFKVLERNAKNDKPNWVWAARETVDGPPVPFANCLGGARVEIDAPVGTTISFEARTSGATIDSVKSVSVKVIEGSIGIRNVSGGVKAETYQGDVMLESSAGEIALKTTTGNILAYDVNPGGIGDLLNAQTSSGTISLQKVNHRQIKASSISGSVLFNSGFLTGGIYNFKTSNGSIELQIPADASSTFIASLGFGSFNSAIPLDVQSESITPGGKSIVAKLGNGSATVNLTTTSGTIRILKQK